MSRAKGATSARIILFMLVAVVALVATTATADVATARAADSRPLGRRSLIPRSVIPGAGVHVGTTESCPWTTMPEIATLTPTQLAQQVVEHMDVVEKLDIVDLYYSGPYENSTRPIPALCLPAFTLQDGPDGVAFRLSGVTQLPAPLGVAASFDTALVHDYGVVEGEEARDKGIDALQGPTLNLDRVANSGRAFEGYGEDPYLTSELGVANILGIQSQGVMAVAKHFTAYNEESDRRHLNEVISQRALNELYLPAFRAAVQQGHVAAIMCAYGEINGTNACADPFLYGALASWGFTGFIRSDLRSVTDPIAAFRAGLDEIKPAVPQQIRTALGNGTLSIKRLDDAVTDVLSEMFAYNLIQQPRPKTPRANVATADHGAFAETAAESSMVLLKNGGNLLPLSPRQTSSVAVIGSDASTGALTSGFGSSHVTAPFVITPLAAMERKFGRSKVSFARGGESIGNLPAITVRAFSSYPGVTRSFKSAIPASYRTSVETITDVVTPPQSGLYTLSFKSAGAAWLFVNGTLIADDPAPHGPLTWDTAVNLVRAKSTTLTIIWAPGEGPAPQIGWQYDSAAITSAVAVAHHAKIAVVFVGAPSGEGADRPTLSLPGDDNELIAAVAHANPRTVVVLNTPGAVLMPWLSQVKGVLEAWYPGEQDGAATSAVLTGAFDPSGHLPVTFPRTARNTPAASLGSYPGINNVVQYSEGLDIGYRYFDANNITPLFPFGFGLSYTSFSLSHYVVLYQPTHHDYSVSVTVTNAGKRQGSEVVQTYIGFPATAGEPPLQLKGFGRITLDAGASGVVTMTLAGSAFRAYLNNALVTVAGQYTINVGTSSSDIDFVSRVVAPNADVIPAAPTH